MIELIKKSLVFCHLRVNHCNRSLNIILIIYSCNLVFQQNIRAHPIVLYRKLNIEVFMATFESMRNNKLLRLKIKHNTNGKKHFEPILNFMFNRLSQLGKYRFRQMQTNADKCRQILTNP